MKACTRRPLNRDGVLRLAAKVYEDAKTTGRLDVALDWAIMCGEDGYIVACALIREFPGYRDQPEDCARDYHYSHGNRCPVCDVLITNAAQSCKLHIRRNQ